MFSLCLLTHLRSRPIVGHHRIAGEAADAERNLQLVPEHVLLLPAQRGHLEGK